MKVLVTGGAGFIGSHICDVLAAEGHEPVVVDKVRAVGSQNLTPGIRVVTLDLAENRECAHLENLIALERPDAVCHLAAQADVRKSVADPLYDAEINIIATLRLLEACVANGVKRFVFSSSGGVCYGEQGIFPAPETHPLNPVCPYGVSKVAGEKYLNYYWEEKALSYVALRYGNVYGPRQNPHGEAGVVAIFCNKLLQDQACTIYGDGQNTRDFVYVEDVARANLLALTSTHVGPLNIGTGIETSINRLYGMLSELAAPQEKLVYGPAKPGEQRRSVIDPGLAKTALGWEPKVKLAEGLSRTLDWFWHR